MNAISQILMQIRSILGIANSARYTADSIKRETDRFKKKKETKKGVNEPTKN